jgi:hypothetical protein
MKRYSELKAARQATPGPWIVTTKYIGATDSMVYGKDWWHPIRCNGRPPYSQVYWSALPEVILKLLMSFN